MKPETKRDKGTTHADSDILLEIGWGGVGGEGRGGLAVFLMPSRDGGEIF